MLRRALLATALLAAVVVTAATAGRDPLVGVWVAHDTQGDGSTDRYIFSAPNADGVRHFTLVDSYGSFCETDGSGTGAPLTAQGTATLDGSNVTTLIDSVVCGNGKHEEFDPPLSQQSTLTSAGLNVGGYYVAVRVGE